MVLARDSCSFLEVSDVETQEVVAFRTLGDQDTMVSGIGLARARGGAPAKPTTAAILVLYGPVTAVTYPLDGVSECGLAGPPPRVRGRSPVGS